MVLVRLAKMCDRAVLVPLGIAFGSGIGMGLATAPLNFFPLAWVALVPLWVMVFGWHGRQISGSELAIAPPARFLRPPPTLLALAWGIGYHGFALAWITGLHPLTWLGVPWLASIAIALFCWAFITLWGAALVAIWTWLMGLLLAHTPRPTPHIPWFRILSGTALWCALEWVWSFGSLYWTALSYTQSPGNLAILHLGQLSGPAMVTAAIVAVNGFLGEAWIAWNRPQKRDRPSRNHNFHPFPPILTATSHILLVLTGILLIFLHLLGYWLSSQPLNDQAVSRLNVGIVQGNVPTRIKLSPEGVQRAILGYSTGYEKLASQGVEAVLTPEGALPVLWDDRTKGRNPFHQAVVDKGVIAWLGTFTTTPNGRITQSLLTLTGTGETFSRYNKIKLVPLGEYIPFQEVLGALISRLSPIESDMVPGTADQRFDTPFGRAIASICYESAFPELFRAQAADGGKFILTASNLDPYSEVLMAQHQAQDLMRAIETDRWAVRATNTGYSGIINPHGQIIWRSQPQTQEIHADTIYRRQTKTPYVHWGDWLTPFLVSLSAVVWVFQWVANRRKNQ